MNKTNLLPVIIGIIIGVFFIGCDDNDTTGGEPNGILVCFGDSLTAGYGATTQGQDDKTKSYPAFLQKKLKIPVINAGKSGDTTTTGLTRVNTDVLSENPTIVIIELGANDFLRGTTPVTTTKSNLQSIIDLLKGGKRKIYLAKFYTETVAGEIFSGSGVNNDALTELIAQYDDMFSTLATSNGIELIEDIWAGVWGIHMSDTIHPNAQGYEIMADNYFKVLQPYLKAQNLIK
jgi:acyl-CoA thioesterase-1